MTFTQIQDFLDGVAKFSKISFAVLASQECLCLRAAVISFRDSSEV